MIDVAALKDWLPVAQLVGTAAVFVVALWLRSKFVPREEFDSDRRDTGEALAEISRQIEAKRSRLDAGEARFERLDRALVTLPQKDDLHGLGLQITRLAGSIDTLGARFEGHEKLVERLEQSVGRHESIFAEGRR